MTPTEAASYEFCERVAIILEGSSQPITEAEAIAAARRQERESRSMQMIRERNA